jgi:hypothetical protein
MTGFVLARSIFVAAVVYTAWVINPVGEHPLASAGLGLTIRARDRRGGNAPADAAVTSVLGGLLGFGVGLWLANTIVGALTWSNTEQHQSPVSPWAHRRRAAVHGHDARRPAR